MNPLQSNDVGQLRPVRVLHLISGLLVGGAESALYKLLGAMDRRRFESRVISLIEVGPMGKRITSLGVPVGELRMRRGRPSVGALVRLVCLLRRERPDVLQSWLYHADLLGAVAGKLARVPGIVWNVRSSDVDMSRYRRLSRWTLRTCARLSRWPAAVVVNSESGKTYHSRIGYRPRRWAVIPNGFDTEIFKPDPAARTSVLGELGFPPGALLVGLIGRFDPMKDHQMFLRAAGILARACPETYFVLVGFGVTADNVELASAVAREGITDRVRLIGERDDVPRLTAALDIAASSSISEGFPSVLGEAMACGVPCVTTDVGDARRLVAGTGIVVPVGAPAAFADACLRLISMGGEGRANLGRQARERIERYYGVRSAAAEYERLYLSLDVGQRHNATAS